MEDHNLPKVLIVGGGFGGLAAARAVSGAQAMTAVIDRQNHHVFQPLLYQVATASLSPADIAAPIRSALRGVPRCAVVLAQVEGVDLERKRLVFDSGTAPYDYLVLAAGVTHDYFGNDQWSDVAPGLKSLSDATELRRRILLAFESAEHEGDPDERRASLTFAVIGAGPTGVEMAGAIKEIASNTLPREYLHIDTSTARVILIEGGQRVLPTFSERLSTRAQADLENLGVEVMLNTRVTNVEPGGVWVGDRFIPAQNAFWAAGVRASPLGASLGVPVDRAGRVIVGPDLSVPGHPEVFVVGDIASYTPAGAERPLPGVAQVAMQMGKHAGGIIKRDISRGPSTDRPAFVYKDKGSMAIIGRNRAIAQVGKTQMAGFIAWLAWAFVHVLFLVGYRNRLRVFFSWGWNWLLSSRDARLVIGDAKMRVRMPNGPGFEPHGSAPPVEKET
ncbi:MAG: NAD(P)/FAD-dependent oxidoreductase [Planctomycetota bacterium]